MLGYPLSPPGEPGGCPPGPPTPKVWVNQGPPLQPPKWLHNPWGHTLAGCSPRDFELLPPPPPSGARISLPPPPRRKEKSLEGTVMANDMGGVTAH